MAYPNLTVVESGNVSLGQAGSILVTSTTAVTAVGGAATDSVTFPQGMTIYGRWTGFQLTATGKVIAYKG